MLNSEWASQVISAALSCFSNVQRLTLAKPPDITPHLYLPRLTHLRIGGDDIASFYALLPCCPVLRKVRAHVRCSPEAVGDLILELERRGVAKVVVGPSVPEERVRVCLPVDRVMWIAIKFQSWKNK